MARDFDNFPTYDPIIKNQIYLSNIWSDFMTTFVESLKGYLSQNGMFLPPITLAQRNEIQNPQEGQIIYVSDSNSPTLPRTGATQVYEMVGGVLQWVTK